MGFQTGPASAKYLRTRLLVIGLLGAIAVIVLALQPAIPQDLRYHAFVDARDCAGIPNFWNVISNLPFLLFGLWGLYTLRRRELPGLLPALRPAYLIFFIGAALVALGSGYYHLQPNNATLVWDRLPMTIAFMAFLSIIIGEHIDLRLARRLLLPLIVIGVASVLYWHITEARGHGDLRPYAAVQFVPVIFIPLMLWLLPSRLNSTRFFWLVIVTYALAKVLEFFDGATYEQLHVISGHSLKHMVAALGIYFMVLALQRRTLGAAATR
ncbi:MAG: ceramidase domain-containing protein [Spongiibacteraceae bacterium]